ncbi:MAG TPA: serine/threonine-protein kinase, partial [Vicinamibacteria bacterium]|nr:serine/threonine-protein kinase [Vicinamibacteria bacterium]
ASPDQQEGFDRRFLAEARAAAGLSHPAVVVVHDLGRDPATGRPFIAFERLRGRTLDEVVRDQGPYEWRHALDLAAQVARALHTAHERGIVHRDIKPANIMVLDDGRPKIMDFGIAKLPSLELTSTGQFMGTPSYVSPEQLATEPLDGRSDLFSLGAVLYFMLTGRVAFDGGTIPATLALVTFRDPAPPSRSVPGLPPDVDAVVARALAKAPADRHASALELAEDLEDVAAGRRPRHLERRKRDAMGTIASRALPVEALLDEADLEPLPLDAAAGGAVARPRSPLAPSSGPWWKGRRGLLAAGGAAIALGIAALANLPGGGLGPSGPLATLGMPPAQLEVDLEHTLKSGTLRVWVDDELALEEPLESYVSEDLVLLKLRKGRERATLKVKPGEREVRVQLSGDGWSGTRRLSGAFESGQTRRLYVRMGSLGGILNKELRASWGG